MMDDTVETDRLMTLIKAALTLADEQGDTLVAALLTQCVEASASRSRR